MIYNITINLVLTLIHLNEGWSIMEKSKRLLLKNHFLLFVFWLFLGWFGAHRFYMKKYKSAYFNGAIRNLFVAPFH